MHNWQRIMAATGVAGLIVGGAQANVYITEVFPGGVPGKEATSDWFELTNTGGSTVDITGWLYDDKSADPTEDGRISGVRQLAAGESAVVLASWSDDWSTGWEAVDAFTSHWGESQLAGVQIGYVLDKDNEGGGGMSGGGEQIYLFDADGNVVDTKQYLEGRANTWVVNPSDPGGALVESSLGSFGSFASQTPVTDDPAAPQSIGSPGTLVPEPSSLALMGLGGLAMLRRRRQQA